MLQHSRVALCGLQNRQQAPHQQPQYQPPAQQQLVLEDYRAAQARIAAEEESAFQN